MFGIDLAAPDGSVSPVSISPVSISFILIGYQGYPGYSAGVIGDDALGLHVDQHVAAPGGNGPRNNRVVCAGLKVAGAAEANTGAAVHAGAAPVVGHRVDQER